MTIKQTFSAILSGAFMTATGLVIGTPVTPKEFSRLPAKRYAEKALKKVAKLHEKISQIKSQLKFHKFMNEIHTNDYR